MKYFLIIMVLLGCIAGAVLFLQNEDQSHSGVAIHPSQPSTPAIQASDNASAQSPCDTSLWQHVYHSSRLRVIENCKTVTGTVESVRTEDDGDEHIALRLDAGQENLVNEKNLSGQHGDLVVEAVCVKKVTQQDAVSSCIGYVNEVRIPHKGERVSVTGPFVNDEKHGWNEIHPATKIVSLGTDSITR